MFMKDGFNWQSRRGIIIPFTMLEKGINVLQLFSAIQHFNPSLISSNKNARDKIKSGAVKVNKIPVNGSKIVDLNDIILGTGFDWDGNIFLRDLTILLNIGKNEFFSLLPVREKQIILIDNSLDLKAVRKIFINENGFNVEVDIK